MTQVQLLTLSVSMGSHRLASQSWTDPRAQAEHAAPKTSPTCAETHVFVSKQEQEPELVLILQLL